MNDYLAAAGTIGTLIGLFTTHPPEPESVPDVGFDGWTEETQVDVNTAIMEGIKDELHQIPGIAIFKCSEETSGDSHAIDIHFDRHAIDIRLDRYRCKLFIACGYLTLIRAGTNADNWQPGDDQAFDLADPDSIPKCIEAVKEMCGVNQSPGCTKREKK